MKVTFFTEFERLNDHRIVSKRTKIERTLVIEDDGTEAGGRTIAKFWRREDAVAVAAAMGWKVTYEG